MISASKSDTFIRAFVSRHIHFAQNYMRRVSYEWPECKSNVQSRSDAISSTYTLDKSVFKLFKSSSLHTKITRKVPTALYALPLLLALFVGGIFYVKNSLASKITKAEPVASSQIAKEKETIPDVQQDFDTQQNIQMDFAILSGAYIVDKTGVCVAFSQQGTVMEVSQYECHQFQKNKSFRHYDSYLKSKIKTMPRPNLENKKPQAQSLSDASRAHL